MNSMHLHFEPQRSDMMARVSLRTLILMVELLAAVVAWQYCTVGEPIQARAIWLAADCHTASSMRERVAGPVATAPAPATAGEATREP
jgi:hypothetical protein